MSTLADRLRQAIKQSGLSEAEVARRVGISQQAVNSLVRGRSTETAHIVKLADVLQVNVVWLDKGQGQMRDVNIRQGANPEPVVVGASMPKDVPVLGTAIGGAEGDFQLNTGEIMDFVRRPPGLLGNKGIFAVYLNGDSMEPWRVQGDPIYCDPHRRPRPGQHVLVEMLPLQEGEPGPAYVKKLVAETPTQIRLAQYNPPDDKIVLPLKRVKRMFRVIEVGELLGV